MYSKTLVALGAALTMSAGMAYAQGTVKIGIIAELSGPGAPSGTNWRDGAELAVKQINAAGGILGKKIVTQVDDTQTDPMISRALVQKAIDWGAYVIWGPVYSGSTIVNMLVAEQNGVPQLTGSEAPAIVQKGNPYIFRTSSGAEMGIPSLIPYFTKTLNVKKVGIAWVNNEFGKGGHDVFAKLIKKAGVDVVADVPSEEGQADYSADVSKLKQSGAQAVFVYMNQEESARFLIEANKQGLSVPLVGEVTLTDPKVVQLAGAAANGALAHVGVTPDATSVPGIAEFDKAFEAAYNRKPTHDAIKAYIGAWTTKYVTDMVGKFDRKAFAAKLHGLCLKAKDYPHILLDTCWDAHGEVTRPSFMEQVKDGKPVVIATVPIN